MTTNPEENPLNEPDVTPETDIATENEAFEEAEEKTEEQDETQKLRSEVSEIKDKYLRLVAEFDNFRKRTAKEKTDLVKTASESLMQALLPVLDDAERAQAALAASENGQVDKAGIELVFNKLMNTVAAKGLKPLGEKGEAFDVDRHECITQFPAPTEEEKGKVIDVVEKGYTLHDKVIRFAKVVVGN
jgi:molecular chaperone GrpE